MIKDEDVDDENLTGRERNISKVDDAIPVVKDYKTIIKIKKKDIINIAYRLEVLFKKFKESKIFQKKSEQVYGVFQNEIRK